MGVCSAPKSVVTVAQSPSRRLVIAASTQKSDATHAAAHAALSRRVTLAGAAAAATTLLTSRLPAAAAEEATASSAAASIKVLEDQPGSGTAEARSGDLVMVHYVGVVAADGTLFDSTLGGEVGPRDGGPSSQPLPAADTPDGGTFSWATHCSPAPASEPAMSTPAAPSPAE